MEHNWTFIGFTLAAPDNKFHVPYFQAIYRKSNGEVVQGEPKYVDEMPETAGWLRIACEAQKQLLRFIK